MKTSLKKKKERKSQATVWSEEQTKHSLSRNMQELAWERGWGPLSDIADN